MADALVANVGAERLLRFFEESERYPCCAPPYVNEKILATAPPFCLDLWPLPDEQQPKPSAGKLPITASIDDPIATALLDILLAQDRSTPPPPDQCATSTQPSDSLLPCDLLLLFEPEDQRVCGCIDDTLDDVFDDALRPCSLLQLFSPHPTSSFSLSQDDNDDGVNNTCELAGGLDPTTAADNFLALFDDSSAVLSTNFSDANDDDVLALFEDEAIDDQPGSVATESLYNATLRAVLELIDFAGVHWGNTAKATISRYADQRTQELLEAWARNDVIDASFWVRMACTPAGREKNGPARFAVIVLLAIIARHLIWRMCSRETRAALVQSCDVQASIFCHFQSDRPLLTCLNVQPANSELSSYCILDAVVSYQHLSKLRIDDTVPFALADVVLGQSTGPFVLADCLPSSLLTELQAPDPPASLTGNDPNVAPNANHPTIAELQSSVRQLTGDVKAFIGTLIEWKQQEADAIAAATGAPKKKRSRAQMELSGLPPSLLPDYCDSETEGGSLQPPSAKRPKTCEICFTQYYRMQNHGRCLGCGISCNSVSQDKRVKYAHEQLCKRSGPLFEGFIERLFGPAAREDVTSLKFFDEQYPIVRGARLESCHACRSKVHYCAACVLSGMYNVDRHLFFMHYKHGQARQKRRILLVCSKKCYSQLCSNNDGCVDKRVAARIQDEKIPSKFDGHYADAKYVGLRVAARNQRKYRDLPAQDLVSLAVMKQAAAEAVGSRKGIPTCSASGAT